MHNDEVDKIIEAILDLAQTGEGRNGLISVHKLDELIKIRTGEKTGPYNL